MWLGPLVILTIVLEHAIGGSQWHRGLTLVRRAGWLLAFVLLGTPLALSFDALGWRQVLRNLGTSVPWSQLARIRIISESLVLSLPGGFLAAEAAKYALLNATGSVAPPRSAASLALVRVLHAVGASAYLALVALIIWSLPAGMLDTNRAALLGLALAGSLLMALASRLVLGILRRATFVPLLADRLQRSRWRRLSQAAARYRSNFEKLGVDTDTYFTAGRGARALALAPFFAQWLLEGLETAFILALLHADIGLRGALIIDGLTALARACAVFVPAGLGVQEVSQAFLLHALGVSDDAATAAGLIFIKRMKELFWIVTGALMAAGTKRPWHWMVRTQR